MYQQLLVGCVLLIVLQVDFEGVAAMTGAQSATEAEKAVKSALYKGLDTTEIKDAVLALQIEHSEVCQWSGCSKPFLTPGDLFVSTNLRLSVELHLLIPITGASQHSRRQQAHPQSHQPLSLDWLHFYGTPSWGVHPAYVQACPKHAR